MEFNADLWEGVAQRIRQMAIANTGEHRLNWAVKLHKRERVVKSVANLLFARGDEVYENRTIF